MKVNDDALDTADQVLWRLRNEMPNPKSIKTHIEQNQHYFGGKY
jgi:hypothetical protein